MSGNNQTGVTTRSLAQPFVVNDAANVSITFTVNPGANGASGTFPGGASTFNTSDGPSGYAVPPLLTANSIAGSFTVTAADTANSSVTFDVTTTACVANPAPVSSNGDSGAGTLRDTVTNACAGSTITFGTVTSPITLSSRLRIDDNLVIQGPGASVLAIDGGSLTRLFFIGNGMVGISGLTLQNGLGKGGNSDCGGAAAGMGGAIFQNNGYLTLSDVTFTGNKAQGGSAVQGSDFAGLIGGGGGFGGNATSNGNGAGGGDLLGIGGVANSDGTGGSGGDGAGGGAGVLDGGTGGFAGGGGLGTGFSGEKGTVGGSGGFGGGGGGALNDGLGGNGGFGAGNGTGGVETSAGTYGIPYGGGGAGFGGAVFLRYGSLALDNNTFNNNSAVGGSAGSGATGGQGKGGALFIFSDLTSGAPNTGAFDLGGNAYPGSVAAQAGENSANPYGYGYASTQLTCPGEDTADICGTLTSLAGATLSPNPSTPQNVNLGATVPTLTATISTGTPNVPIVFSTPTSGASATFSNGATSAVAYTNASGVATAPVLTANNTTGNYTITASIGSISTSFSITNNGTPTLSISKSHSGSFTQGDTADVYIITVNNTGNGATSGTLSLTDTLPTGMTAASMSETANTGGGTGSDWTCAVASASCTRTTAMAAGETDTITLTVSVSYNTPTGTNAVTNSVSVSGGGASSSTANDPTTINIGPGYTLTIGVNPSGAGTVSANPTNSPGMPAGHYVPGTPVQLTATANTGYNFSNWTGTNTGTSNTLNVGMNGPVSETANFVAATVQVTVGTNPAGLSFSVDSVTYMSTQTLTWNIGSPHTITTISPQTAPGTQYTFSSWSDGGAISHMVNAPSTATAYIATFSVQYQLTTGVLPSGSGTVTPVSGSYYPAGTVVSLTASANRGYKFQSWTGTVASPTSTSTTVTMTAPETVTANFTEGLTALGAVLAKKSGPQDAREWTFLVANTGPGAANAAEMNTLTLRQNSGKSCGAHITSPIPVLIGNMAPLSTTFATVTIDFADCGANATFTVSGTLTANQGRAKGIVFGHDEQ